MNKETKMLLDEIYSPKYLSLSNENKCKKIEELILNIHKDTTSPDWLTEGIKNIKYLKFKKLPQNINGKYDYKHHLLTLNQDNLNYPNIICHALIHEIVHAYEQQHPELYHLILKRNIKINILNKQLKIKSLIINGLGEHNIHIVSENNEYKLNDIFYVLSNHERDAELLAFDYLKDYERINNRIENHLIAFCNYYNIPCRNVNEEKNAIFSFLDKCYDKIINHENPSNDLEATVMYDISYLSAFEQNKIKESDFIKDMDLIKKQENLNLQGFRIHSKNYIPLNLYFNSVIKDKSIPNLKELIELYSNLDEITRKEETKLAIYILNRISKLDTNIQKSFLKNIPNTIYFKKELIEQYCNVDSNISNNDKLLSYFLTPQEVNNIKFLYDIMQQKEHICVPNEIKNRIENIKEISLEDILTLKNRALYNEYPSVGRPISSINEEYLRQYIDCRDLPEIKQDNDAINIVLFNDFISSADDRAFRKLTPNTLNLNALLRTEEFYEINDLLMFADNIVLYNTTTDELNNLINHSECFPMQNIIAYNISEQFITINKEKQNDEMQVENTKNISEFQNINNIKEQTNDLKHKKEKHKNTAIIL